ncbi:MAG: arsenite methyltransferase [Longimicrobiales bacterium]|nr:arsenite methyltransferase [Longimicrobiales bacterium]
MSNANPSDLRSAVLRRYARAAEEGEGCCASSCCSGPDLGYEEEALASVPQTADLGLGCGNPTAFASLRNGETVLDLGSGGGIDCFLASGQVGPEGRVIGVDMTPQMVDRARKAAREGGFANVEFRLGEIEALPVPDESVDVVISNCVLNLTHDKVRVLQEVHRVLKKRGRLAISDLVSDRSVPAALRGDLDAVAACLPTFRDDYLDAYRRAGFADVRIVEERPYPSEYLLSDDGVRAVLSARPELRAEIEAFASSLAGAHFEARKTT